MTSYSLLHHKHSGKLRPHEHTSYGPLAILLLIIGVILCVYTVKAAPPGPAPSSVGLSGIVPGKPPDVAATITKPVNGQRFATSPVTVAGTCPKNTLVEVFKNKIFAGSIPCSDDGTYSLDVDLLIGKNTLVARVYDNLNQAGPDSNKVVVYYDAIAPNAGPLTSLDFGGAQLLLNTDAVYRGIFPNQEMAMPIDILGGTPPYAINVQWGDSSNKVIPRKNNLTFSATHAYQKPGNYQVSIQGSDANGRVAFLTVAAIVNGQPPITAAAADSTPNSVVAKLLALWPLYTSTVAVAISFWLGERREKHVLAGRGPVYHS